MTGYPKTFIPLHIQRSRAAFCSVKTYSLKRNKQRSFHDWSLQNLYSLHIQKSKETFCSTKTYSLKRNKQRSFHDWLPSSLYFLHIQKSREAINFVQTLFFEKNKGVYYALPSLFSNCFRNNVEKSFTLTKNVLI